MSMFVEYKDAEQHFKKVRSPARGRPVKSWCRMFKEGGDYVVKLTGWGNTKPFFHIHPDNTLTFVLSVDDLQRSAQTVMSSTFRIVPIHLMRFKKGVYRIGSERELGRRATGQNQYQWNSEGWKWLKSEAPQYFNGIRFDLKTGECLNSQPDMATTIIPDERKKWLRDLRRYKRGLKARAKVGALTGFVTEENTFRSSKPTWQDRYARKPVWHEDNWRQTLILCMREEAYPPEILKGFVASVDGWHSTIEDRDVFDVVDKIFTSHSETLRREYGVFGETLHSKE